jgi:hypothetical protein
MRVIPLAVVSACVPDGIDGAVVILDGAVVDAEGAPIEGAEVSLQTVEGVALGSVESDSAGGWSFPVLATDTRGNRVEASVTVDGYAPGVGGWDVNLIDAEVQRLKAGPVRTWEGNTRRLAPLRLAAEGTGGQALGTIIDPFGSGVSGLPLIAQPGWNATVGDSAVASATTGGDGSFVMTFDEPGLYTIYAAPTGDYAGCRFPVMATAAGTSTLATITTWREPGQLLATLTWSGSADLDLHLTAPDKDVDGEGAESRFHVWADDPTHPDRPEADQGYVAEFLVGATQGPGPETVVVNDAPGVGYLHLGVHDRSGMSGTADTDLAASGALLQWWNGEDIPRYAWVSPLAVANAWVPVYIDTRGGVVFDVEIYEQAVEAGDEEAF